MDKAIAKYADKLIEALIIFAAVFSPLAFGAVHKWAFTLIELSVLAILFLWAMKVLAGPDKVGICKNPLNLPLVLFLGLILFQMLPLPPGLLKIVSAKAYGVYAGQSGSLERWYPITIYSYATKEYFFKLLAYAILLLAIVNNMTGRGQRNRLLAVLIIVGAFEALYGLIERITGHQQIFFFKKAYYVFSATGTYVNKNHFAGYLEMVIPVAIAIALYVFAGGRGESKPAGLRRALTEGQALPRFFLFLLLIMLMLVALGFSDSRMAWFSLFLSLAFMGLLLLKKGKKGAILVFPVIVAGFFLLQGWLGFGRIEEALEGLKAPGSSLVTRPMLWAKTLELISDYPLLGTGLGTYLYSFAKYKSPELGQVYYDYTHNDYLQLTAELGLIGLLLFLWAALRTGRFLWPAIGGRRSHILAVGAATSLLAMAIHSFADFNLHIPANALLFTIILGLLLTMGIRTRAEEQPSAEPVPSKRSLSKGKLAGAMVMALIPIVLGYFLVREWRAWQAFDRHDRLVKLASQNGGTVSYQVLLKGAGELERAAQLDGANADYHYQLGLIYNYLAYQDSSQRAALLARASSHLKRATQLNPYQASAHLQLGYNYLLAGDYRQSLGLIRQAYALEPASIPNQLFLGETLLSLGKYQEAAPFYATFKQVLAQDSYNTANFRYLGRLVMQQEGREGAKAIVSSLMKRGEEAAKLRNYLKSLDLYNTILNIDPSQKESRLFAALIYERAGQTQTASTLLAQDAGPPESGLYLNYHQGRLLYMAGKFEEAATSLRKEVQGNPSNITALALLESSYLKMGTTAEATKVGMKKREMAAKLFPAVFLGESFPALIGTNIQDGQVSGHKERFTSKNSGSNYMAYGPYVSLPPGEYRACFWLKGGATGIGAFPVAKLDVVSLANAGNYIAGVYPEATLRAQDFSTGKGGAYRPFCLDFIHSGGPGLQFRVLSLGEADLWLDRVTVELKF